MDYEYIENIAEEFGLQPGDLDKITRELGIITLQMGVPPSGARVAAAVTHRDAQRLRAYCAAQQAG